MTESTIIPDSTVIPDSAPDSAAGTEPDLDTQPRPRIRAAGIAWGLLFIAAAVALLTIAGDNDRRAAAVEWALSLTPGGAILISVLALGALLLLGLLGGVRNIQRTSERRRD